MLAIKKNYKTRKSESRFKSMKLLSLQLCSEQNSSEFILFFTIFLKDYYSNCQKQYAKRTEKIKSLQVFLPGFNYSFLL